MHTFSLSKNWYFIPLLKMLVTARIYKYIEIIIQNSYVILPNIKKFNLSNCHIIDIKLVIDFIYFILSSLDSLTSILEYYKYFIIDNSVVR